MSWQTQEQLINQLYFLFLEEFGLDSIFSKHNCKIYYVFYLNKPTTASSVSLVLVGSKKLLCCLLSRQFPNLPFVTP